MSAFSITRCDQIFDPDNDKNITMFIWMESLQMQMKNSLWCKTFIILWKSIMLIMFCFLFLPDCLNLTVFLCLWFQRNSVHHLLPWKTDLFKLVMKDIYFSFVYIPSSKFYPFTVVIIHVLLPWWNNAKNILCVYFSFSGEGLNCDLFFGPW